MQNNLGQDKTKQCIDSCFDKHFCRSISYMDLKNIIGLSAFTPVPWQLYV